MLDTQPQAFLPFPAGTGSRAPPTREQAGSRTLGSAVGRIPRWPPDPAPGSHALTTPAPVSGRLQSRVSSRPTAQMTFRKGTPGGPDLLRRVLKRGGALSGARDSTHEKFCCWLQRRREPCARSGGGLRPTARSKQARVLPDGSWLSGHPKAPPRGTWADRHLALKCWEPEGRAQVADLQTYDQSSVGAPGSAVMP